MKLIIAGSRSLDHIGLANAAVTRYLLEDKISEIVSGGARGIDQVAIDYACEQGYPSKVFPADWDQYGRSAGYIRNVEMATYADALLAIWDGHSKGTLHMINAMHKQDKPVHVMEVYFK